MDTLTQAIPATASLFYQDNRSDKIYNVTLQQCDTGWSVFVTYGRRGSTLQSQTKCEREAFEKAKSIYDSTLRDKLSKGYQYVDAPKVEIYPPNVPDPGATLSPMEMATTLASVLSHHANKPASKEVVFSPELLTRIDSVAEAKAYIRSPRYFLQTKRDGVRLTIVAETAEKIFGYNKLGQVVQLDPRLRIATLKLMESAQLTGVILDGEWEASGFWAWDVLYLNYDTRTMCYEDRLDLLQELLNAPDVMALKMFNLVPTGRTESTKQTLYDQLKAKRAEGVVFKNKDAQYRGGRTGQHYKFKFETFASVIVGPKPKKDDHRSVGMYVIDKGRKRYVGSVKIADKYQAPAEGAVIDVRYLYVLKGFDARLYQPCWFGTVRWDVLPEQCLAEQLKLKQDEKDAAA